MSAFDDDKVRAAIDRLPKMASKAVKDMKATAERAGLPTLIEACDRELARRPIEYSGDMALAFETMAAQVEDMDLTSAIRHAFTIARRPSPDEIRFLRWIAANPDATYQAAEKAYGKGDLGLTIGHLVYDRYGCFRKFRVAGEDQSSVLLHKDRTGGSVRYRLKAEAEAVFKELGIT